jgi:hypothetical protein
MKKYFFSVIVFLAICSIQSCTKEEEYEGSVVFWMDKDTRDFFPLLYEDVTSLKYYVNDELVGTSGIVSWTGAPNCGQNGSITAKLNLGASETKGFSYYITDQKDDVLKFGTVNLESNKCLKHQLFFW